MLMQICVDQDSPKEIVMEGEDGECFSGRNTSVFSGYVYRRRDGIRWMKKSFGLQRGI